MGMLPFGLSEVLANFKFVSITNDIVSIIRLHGTQVPQITVQGRFLTKF